MRTRMSGGVRLASPGGSPMVIIPWVVCCRVRMGTSTVWPRAEVPAKFGTVFPSEHLSPLLSFTGLNGVYPQGGLLQDSAGNLYGTTQYGGADYGTVETVETGPIGPVLCYTACITISTIHHVLETVVIKVVSIYCQVACFLGPDEPPPDPWKPVKPKQPKDPNEKQGPPGCSAAGFVGSQVPWQYIIHFENVTNAPAFARQVSIQAPSIPIWTSARSVLEML
jgi:hypothetical protein